MEMEVCQVRLIDRQSLVLIQIVRANGTERLALARNKVSNLVGETKTASHDRSITILGVVKRQSRRPHRESVHLNVLSQRQNWTRLLNEHFFTTFRDRSDPDILQRTHRSVGLFARRGLVDVEMLQRASTNRHLLRRIVVQISRPRVRSSSSFTMRNKAHNGLGYFQRWRKNCERSVAGSHSKKAVGR